MSLRARLQEAFRAWIRKRNPLVRGRLRLNSRRIYILPTGSGVLFAIMVLIMLLTAMNYANSLTFGVGFLLGAMGLVAMHHTHRNLLGLEVQGLGATPVFAGEDARFRLRLTNSRRVARPGIELDTDGITRDRTDLAAGTSRTLSFHQRAESRGILRARRFHLACRYPLGLFRAWSPVRLDMATLVYPRPAEDVPPVPAVPGDQGNQASEHSGGQEDFHGLRDFRQGDPWRHISWQALAREQGLATKLFAEPLDERRWLDWAALGSNDPEHRLSILCRWILDCERQHLVYGLRLPGTEIPPGRGAAHREQCLRALAEFPVAGATAS